MRLSSADCSRGEGSSSASAFYSGYSGYAKACASGFCGGSFSSHGISALGLKPVGLDCEYSAFYNVWS